MAIPKASIPIFTASLIALPSIVLAVMHVHLSAPMTALIAGTSILAAAFLLLWACDAAQADISPSLALAIVAFIAVLPEYAVDMYFTWMAGKHPEADYAHYAIANMTGANRLIIGIAWTAVVVIFWFKTRREVVLEEERRLEIQFLAAATVWAFFIAFKGSLMWYDTVVLVGMYVAYVIIAGRRPTTDFEVEGPALYITSMPVTKRRIVTISLFIFAAGIILANAERFSEGLVGTGKQFGIDEFLLVQWLAPLASETPEFIVAIMFALRARAGMALGTLVSAKLNQWTLLVGMIPLVFALSSGALSPSLPVNHFQLHEILLTAAQSLLAVVMIATLRLSVGQAALLFGLFCGQLISPAVAAAMPDGMVLGLPGEHLRPLFTILYLMSTLAILANQPHRLLGLWPSRRRCSQPEAPDNPEDVPEHPTGANENGPICETDEKPDAVAANPHVAHRHRRGDR